ncbi:SWR1-complex protein 4-like [Camellia sinensis]|uniref:SWR1-complex protein 4-like n=1 Tax=Camellia sinensis TaxID=4442 RepID=UPI001036765B|nr:SWR1-complex protein 4-like [Camellia sinensis]
MDAKDILGLPKTPLPLPQEKKSRPQKDSQRKPDGISREVYALTGGLAPLMPSIDVAKLKRRTQSQNEKITWQWLPFSNSAQKDNLQLYHWVRVVNVVPPTGDYSFAKYNKVYISTLVSCSLSTLSSTRIHKDDHAGDLHEITWQWLPFSNSARKDNLQLYHWVRVVNVVPPTGDYSFAKYNKCSLSTLSSTRIHKDDHAGDLHEVDH